MLQLHLDRHGQVPDEESRTITSLLEECYGRLRPERLDVVEIALFESDRLWRSYRAAERRKAKVVSTQLDDTFIAAHEAWTGIPRISISLERRGTLPQLVWEGALRHEVGHSVLHGELEYYLFPMPAPLLKVVQKFGTLRSHLTDILYLLTLGVKDMEVTKLLFSHDYVDDQVAYARFVMKPAGEDRQAWDISRVAPEARVLFLVGRLKELAAAMALTSRPEVSQVCFGEAEESVSYLPQEIRRALLNSTNKILEELTADTFSNVQTAASLLVSEIVEPVMRARPTKLSS